MNFLHTLYQIYNNWSSLFFPDQHLKVKAEFFELSIFADDRFQNLLNVYVVRTVFLQHNHMQYSLVDVLSHLLGNLRFLLL